MLKCRGRAFFERNRGGEGINGLPSGNTERGLLQKKLLLFKVLNTFFCSRKVSGPPHLFYFPCGIHRRLCPEVDESPLQSVGQSVIGWLEYKMIPGNDSPGN